MVYSVVSPIEFLGVSIAAVELDRFQTVLKYLRYGLSMATISLGVCLHAQTGE